METVDITPKEIRKTMWTVAMILILVILAWKSPELLALFIK